MKPVIHVLAYNIRSLWNVGALFRTCDAMAVEKLYLTGYTGCPPRNEITKTALGAEEWLPWEHSKDPHPIVERLKADGFSIVSLELTDTAVPVMDFVVPEKLCLVLGHEREGVPSDLLGLSDDAVMIPMLGKKESLNVSVATGVALSHLRHSS